MRLKVLAVMALMTSALFANSELDELLKKANEGDAWSQYQVGRAYYKNNIGAGTNYAKAAEWFEKAALQGIKEAQFSLGVCCERGYGREQSYSDAVYWYRRAAEQGVPAAQFNLGLLYQRGEGVSQSAQDAAKWIAKAAAQGYLNAQIDLAWRYAEGNGVSRSLTTAIEWRRTANRNEEIDGSGMLLAGLLQLGCMLETQHHPGWGSLSSEDETRFLKAAVVRYPEDLFRTNNYWWRYQSEDKWFCSDGFRAEVFQAAEDSPLLMDILVQAFRLEMKVWRDGRPKPKVSYWGPKTIGEKMRGEPLFTWAVWSLRDVKEAVNAPLSKQALLNLLASLDKIDPLLGMDLLNQKDASGTLPLYLAIQLRENDVAEAMIRLYGGFAIKKLRGRDPTGKIKPSGENPNQEAFDVSVMDCAVLADNAEIIRLLVTRFSWPLKEESLWGGNAKDSPLSKAEYYGCQEAKRALMELNAGNTQATSSGEGIWE